MKQKLILTIILSVFFVLNRNLIIAQNIYSKQLMLNIDTIIILPPIGYIQCQYKGNAIIIDTIDTRFSTMFKKALIENLPYKLEFIEDEEFYTELDKKYIAENIYKYSLLSDEEFKKIPPSVRMREMVKDIDGKYFAFIVYWGFDQNNYAAKFLTSVAIGTITSVLTGGFFLVPYNSPSYLKTNILIFNKEYNKLVYSNSSYHNKAPLDEKKLNKHCSKMITGF